MKTLWNMSWSQYSWWEIWQIFKAFNTIISDDTIPQPHNSNILHIAAKSCDLELLKKVVNTEDGIDINERDAHGWTALHIVSYFGQLDMIKFLIEEKNADYKITAEYVNPPIFLCVSHLNFETTKYYLELGEEMPAVSTICCGSRTREKFLQDLENYFQGKVAQEVNSEKYQKILVQIQEKQKEYIETFTQQDFEPGELTVIPIEEKNDSKEVMGDNNNISDLV